MDYGRETVVLFEIDQPLCTRTYGVAPCAAVLGTSGVRKCFNTRATCQDPDNYAPGTLTLRFARGQEDLLQYGPLIPSLIAPETTAASLNLAAMDHNIAALGSRESVTLQLADHQHSDHLVDLYRLQRITGAAQDDAIGYDPNDLGTFWGKWLARNPYHSAYRCRVYAGFLGDALADLRVRHYVVDRIEGPTDGQVTLVAKDLFSIIEAQKAVAPFASKGELAANLTGSPATFGVAPAGIGILAEALGGYAAITNVVAGHVAIGDEIIEVTRATDTFTVVQRGALGTVAADHDAEDLVQEVLSFETELAVDIVYALLLNYTALISADLPKADWDIAAVDLVNLYTGRIATPTPVNDLVGELSEQVGFSLWPDTGSGQIELAALRATAPTVTVDDDSGIIEDSLSIRRLDERRASQVWVYYGQKNPTADLDDQRNFHSRIATPDLAAESDVEYGVPAIREIFSRWIPQFGRAFAEETGERILAMFRDPPIEATFRLHASRDGDLAPARYFILRTAEVQDATGAVLPVTLATVEIERGENELEIRAQQVAFAAPDAGTGERVIYIENDAYNLNLRTVHDSLYAVPDGTETVRFIVVAGFSVGSTSTANPAMQTGSWPAGVALYLDNASRIQGKGGNAGHGSNLLEPFTTAGQSGGDALKATYAITIDNLDGEIWAGGGGGGGTGGIPGSGGAGTDPGAAGTGGNFFGNPGTTELGGASVVSGGSSGGKGGDPGQAGDAGTGPDAHAGGAAGDYIDGNAFVTWVNNGDRRGGVV